MGVISVGISNSLVTDNLWAKAYGFFGLLCVFFMILIGSCINLFLGYNFQRIIIAKKNRASLRHLFVSTYNKCFNLNGIPVLLEPHIKHIPKTESNAQYWILAINCILSVTIIYFLIFIVNNWFIAIDISLVVGMMLAMVFPRISVNYAKYIIIGKALNKNNNERYIRKIYRDWYKRCKATKRTRLFRKIYLVLLATTSFLIIMSFIDYENIISGLNGRIYDYILHGLMIIFFVGSCIAKFFETTPSHYPAFGSYTDPLETKPQRNKYLQKNNGV